MYLRQGAETPSNRGLFLQKGFILMISLGRYYPTPECWKVCHKIHPFSVLYHSWGFFLAFSMLDCSSQSHELNWVMEFLPYILENPCWTIYSELLFLPIHSRKLRTGSHHRMGAGCAGQPPLLGLAKTASHLRNNNQICQVISAFSYGSFGVDHRDHREPEGQQGRVASGDQQGQYSR